MKIDKIKTLTSANREAWNQAMPYHISADQQRLDALFADHDYILQDDPQLIEILNTLPIKGKDIIHLACNNGIELMSLKRLSAGRCVGIDISDEAITEANRRSEKFNIDCQFHRHDIYDIPDSFYNSFDVVHITSGCIGWLPDLDKFFAVCSKLLKKGGHILMHEMHPFSEIMPFDGHEDTNPLQIADSYFYEEPLVETGSLDYIGKKEYESKPQHWTVHQMSTIMMGLANNQFLLKRFYESPIDISMSHQAVMQADAGVPLSMIILAEKS
ncbi:class I SAM-dependent methyltransferase [Puteibacter caeruleilacunae]|nr:class I SAM-dependent methyltransferase [Puteibacter caeruleilacunae]